MNPILSIVAAFLVLALSIICVDSTNPNSSFYNDADGEYVQRGQR